MYPVTNARHVFNSIPTGYPEPGTSTIHDASQMINIEKVSLNGGFLLKTLALSIDPYMRGRMREPHIPSYTPPFILGKPIDNYGVGVVIRSENSRFKQGDHVYGFFEFREYNIINETTGFYASCTVLPDCINLPWSVYTGSAGMAGQTAYCGFKEYIRPRKGDVIFVTAGAGPVGSMVIQLAKLKGMKVIASASSNEKVEFLRQIGSDVAFNYKTTSTREVLQREGPISVYWDNVGGESLQAALDTMIVGGTVIACGSITGYNGPAYHITNLDQVFAKELTIRGFIFLSLLPKYLDEFYREIPPRLASGEFKYLEDRTFGLANAGQAILDVQQGKNVGKSVIIVSEE